MRVNLGDLWLNVETAGYGEPLLLLHGFTGCWRSWRGGFFSLAARFRVTAAGCNIARSAHQLLVLCPQLRRVRVLHR